MPNRESLGSFWSASESGDLIFTAVSRFVIFFQASLRLEHPTETVPFSPTVESSPLLRAHTGYDPAGFHPGLGGGSLRESKLDSLPMCCSHLHHACVCSKKTEDI